MSWFEISALTAVAALLLTLTSTAVIFFIKYVMPNIRHWRQFGTNLIGTPADKSTGQRHIPSIFEQLDQLSTTLEAQNKVLDGIVSHVDRAVQQVANSHVTNLRDDVDEVIGKVDSLHDKIDAITKPPGDKPA